MDFAEARGTVLGEAHDVLARVEPDQVEAFRQELLRAKRVFLAGEGRSGLAAAAFAMRLMHLGWASHVIGEATCPAVESNDLVVIVSGSGETPGPIGIAERAARIGATVVAVTGIRSSTLARAAGLVLWLPGEPHSDQAEAASSQQPLSSLFDQSAGLLLDVVCLMIFRDKRMSPEDLRRRHRNV